ncbi:MAG: tetratricopeptide repeat protein [Promethearchaeota archaeon]
MYEHFRPSERVFVDREEHLDWMSEALQRCTEKSVVLHIRGIGGIGKSSLLDHWHQTVEKSIILDCSRITDFFGRLDVIAKGAVRLGISLSRFDVLWSIRQRFVQGVEPAKEEGRGWAMDIIAPLPFIGSLTGIGTAIKTISQKISPKLTGKYGSLGSWLQSRLGKDYLEELLEILWKDPRNAEFLYLDALLEDLNNRKDSKSPILIILDGFDYVDDDDLHWTYKGRRIAEAELWFVFLSSLVNSVGVVASRKALPKKMDVTLNIEVAELCELDCDSCLELLARRNLIDDALQQKIIEVSGGNPFILDTICDMFSMGGLSSEDVESFRGDTLEEVRNKTWKKLFSQVKDLEPVIEHASLLPHFDRYLLEVVYPKLKTFQWEQLVRFSFVRDRGDGTWELHSLAKDLVLAELGRQLGPLTSEVATLLEKESEEEDNPALLGFAFTVESQYSEEKAILNAKEKIMYHIRRESIKRALAILDNLAFRTTRGKAEIQGMLGWAFHLEARHAEAEAALKYAIGALEELASKAYDEDIDTLGLYTSILGITMQYTSRYREAEDAFGRAVEIQRRLVDVNPEHHSEILGGILGYYGFFVGATLGQAKRGQPLAQEAVDLFRQSENQRELPWALNILAAVQQDSSKEIDLYLEAINLQREELAKDPDNTRAKAVLAAICGNLSPRLLVTGRISDASDIHQEMITIRRELNDINPDVYGGRLALALMQGGLFHLQNRNYSRAEEHLRDAIRRLEILLENEPEGWDYALAHSLFRLTRVLTVSGRASEADSAIGRAILLKKGELSRTANRPSLNAELAQELGLSVLPLYAKTFRVSKADEVIDEMYGLQREYMSQSAMFDYVEGLCLNNSGACKLNLNILEDAKGTLEEAVSILEQHQDLNGLLSKKAFGTSLCNLAIVRRRQGQKQMAKGLYLQSISLIEEKLDRLPIKMQDDYAIILSNYSLLLNEMGLCNEAEACLEKALHIKRQLVEACSPAYESTLAVSLNNLGVLYSASNRLKAAEQSFNEAIPIQTELVRRTPEMYQAGLASSLHNLGILLQKTGRLSDAEETLRAGLEIWEELLDKAPDAFNPKLAKTLHHLSVTLMEAGKGQNEMKAIKKRLASIGFKPPANAELWIEEEEPLFYR